MPRSPCRQVLNAAGMADALAPACRDEEHFITSRSPALDQHDGKDRFDKSDLQLDDSQIALSRRSRTRQRSCSLDILLAIGGAVVSPGSPARPPSLREMTSPRASHDQAHFDQPLRPHEIELGCYVLRILKPFETADLDGRDGVALEQPGGSSFEQRRQCSRTPTGVRRPVTWRERRRLRSDLLDQILLSVPITSAARARADARADHSATRTPVAPSLLDRREAHDRGKHSAQAQCSVGPVLGLRARAAYNGAQAPEERARLALSCRPGGKAVGSRERPKVELGSGRHGQNRLRYAVCRWPGLIGANAATPLETSAASRDRRPLRQPTLAAFPVR